MARNVTVAQLTTDICSAVDVALSTEGRYQQALFTRRINQSVQRLREKLSNEGVQHYLTHAAGTLTPGATSPHSFAVLDLSALSPALVRVYGLDVKVGGLSQTVCQVDLSDARDRYGGPDATGVPSGWANYGTDRLALFPPPREALPYVVYYLPVLPDLVSTSDTWNGVAGWEDYVLYDVAIQLLGRDNYATQFTLLSGLKAEAWQDVLRNATRVTSAGGAHVGRDSFGARVSGQGRAPRLPRP